MPWFTRTFVALLATLIAAITTGEFSAPAASDPVSPPPLELGAVSELTAEQEALMTTSLDRFTQAGLTAPNHAVASFHDSLEACNGNLGLRTTEAGVTRVRVCWAHEDPAIEIRLQEQALVHELAHAWAERNLDDARRDAFVEFTGSASWAGAADAWNDRGTERAADLITWALLDPAVLFVEFAAADCHTWAPAFQLLTDAPAPAPLAGACEGA